MNLIGSSIHKVDNKNRVELSANYKVDVGTEFGLIEESKSMYRAYLYKQLVDILDTLKKGSYDSKDAEEKQKIYERICIINSRFNRVSTVDTMGRILLSSDLAKTSDGFPSYDRFVKDKPRVILIGEGLGMSIVSNEETLKEYQTGKYGFDLESRIRK